MDFDHISVNVQSLQTFEGSSNGHLLDLSHATHWKLLRPKRTLGRCFDQRIPWNTLCIYAYVFTRGLETKWPNSDHFATNPMHIGGRCEWPNTCTVFQSHKSSPSLFAEIGQKLVSVDQKVVMTMMWCLLKGFNKLLLLLLLSRAVVKQLGVDPTWKLI